MFNIVSTHFWLIGIVMTIINWVFFRKAAQKYINENPELREGYDTLLRGFLVWANIPWVVMGLGMTVGGVPSVWDYFRPAEGNPYVLMWLASVFVIWLLGAFWIFFREGAETLARHPGLIKLRYGFVIKDVTSPGLIKVFWLLALAGGIFGVVVMWSSDIPTPKFDNQ